MSILDDRRDISQDTIGQLVKNQRVLSNKNVMMKNLQKLIQNLEDCEVDIDDVIAKKEVGDPEIGRLINKCMGQFNSEDMEILEQMVNANFNDAMLTNSLFKLQLA